MNRQHPAVVTPSWYGDFVGRFEGDTLVIDTVGIKIGPHAMVDWYGTPRTSALHVVERYRLVDYEGAKDGLERDRKENFQVQQDTIDPNYKGKHLQLEFTVEDDGSLHHAVVRDHDVPASDRRMGGKHLRREHE